MIVSKLSSNEQEVAKLLAASLGYPQHEFEDKRGATRFIQEAREDLRDVVSSNNLSLF